MHALFRLILVGSVLGGFAAAGTSSALSAAFNGELLVAPPPPNWSGGALEPTKAGTRRLWRRVPQDPTDPIERVVITQRVRPEKPDINASAKTITDTVGALCADKEISDVTLGSDPEIPTATVSLRCTAVIGSPPGTILYAVIKIFIGEFNVYSARRVWIGNGKNTGGPENSPKTADAWDKYFARIFVCNTLSNDCDPAKAEIVHADPRFKTMRALPVAVRPVMPQQSVLKAASGFGELTGRAESCGEDVSQLTGKIGRMFDYVTANDKDSLSALTLFESSRGKGVTAQDKLNKDSCGQVLRDFRQHPSRASTFYHYIARFI